MDVDQATPGLRAEGTDSAARGLSVVHTTDSLHARHGGPPRTISALAAGLGGIGADVRVLALSEGTPEEAVRPDPRLASTSFVERGRRGRGLGRAVEAVGADVVHDHGIWLPSNHAVARAAARSGTPRVVSARGMLEPWAWAHKRWKKRAAWFAFQRRDILDASVLHATADSEADNIRALGLRQPIAVIPNGVAVPQDTARHAGGRRRALFLSRVHTKKGLPMLLKAWADVRPSGWELVVAGPDDGGHQAELEAQATRLGLDEVRFVGAVPDDEKWDLYRSANLFVLPTHSENFGVVVAEALAAGVPVLTTTGAPWSELASHECGWWVSPDVRSIRDALADAVGRSDDDRRAMGLRGRALVRDRYDWAAIATQMLAVYEWVLGKRPERPPVVRDSVA